MSKLAASVKQCDCAHDYQDAKYGKGKRVHNPSAKGYKCTVCGKLKGSSVVK